MFSLVTHGAGYLTFTESHTVTSDHSAGVTIGRTKKEAKHSAAEALLSLVGAVSCLQELCDKWLGVIPAYQVIADDGPAHRRVYATKVTAREHSATGQGLCFCME